MWFAWREVLDDPEVLAPAGRDGGANDRVRLFGSQGLQALAQLHRHEHREARWEPGSLRVRDSRTLTLRLATRAPALPAPVDEAELLLADLLLHAQQGTSLARM